MKKGEVYEGIIEKVSFPNKGRVMIEEGEKLWQVTVKNGVPGQKVSFRINKKKSGKCEGRLLEVVEKSPLELPEAACSHFGNCGGCVYQNLPYEEQLKLKESQVLELMRQVVKQEDESWFEGIKDSPVTSGYRNKMEFTFGDSYKDGPLSLGMHKRGSFYDIVSVSECQIVDGDYRQILAGVEQYFAEREIPFFHRLRHEGYLRHLLVRKAVKTQEILIDLVTTTQLDTVQEEQLLQGWKDMLLALPLEGTIAGILHTKNDSVADAVKDEGTEILYGQDYFFEHLLGLKFKISPFSFFQTNSLGAEVLYETGREFISGSFADGKQDKVLYDLYSGTGTIAQMMAPVAKEVIGVEIVEEAVEAAKVNAELNGLHNCKFLAGDVLKVLDQIEEKPDVIILDPPRDGIHPKALHKIINYGVDQLLYISCKPTSLQRDLIVLQERGYEVTRMVCVDMFPGTSHVETVVLLSKGDIDSTRVRVEFPLDELEITGLRGKATYEQIKAYVKEQTGLKVSSLYISQIKRACGLEVGDNYHISKKEDARVPQCPPEKEKAIREAFRHFGMIS